MHVLCNSIGKVLLCAVCKKAKPHIGDTNDDDCCYFAKMKKIYRVIEHDDHYNVTGRCFINETGSEIIWSAYTQLHGNKQTKDQREKRGGICWVSELDYWKATGALPSDFDYKKYEV